MNKTEPRTLPGFMELLPQEQILFNQMKDTIRKNYEDVSYTVTEEQNSIIMIIIFTIPVVIIIAGIVVWQVRRRKR